MLVALAIGLVLLLAVMTVQLGAANQNMRISDTTQRDNELRAALDMLTRDVASAGFLLSSSVPNCSARLNYDSGLPASNYFATPQVWAMAGSSGLQLPFVAGGGLTLDYPTTASGNRSDVLVLNQALDATQFGDQAAPTTAAFANSAYQPMSTGLLPLAAAGRATAGHIGLLAIPLNGQRICLRVPITSVGTASSSSYVASSGTLMPANFYSGFSSSLATIGLSGSSLSNALLMQSKLIDIGAPASSNQVSYVYYVSGTSFAWPMLMRAKVNALTDTLISVQPIAAGVVSLQVLLGVDTNGSGSVTAYQTGATVAANNSYASVRSVRIGVIVRSLYADTSYTAPATVSIPGTSTTSPFTAFTVTATQNRHVAQMTEIAVRNTLWSP